MDSKFNKKEKFVIGAVEKYLFFSLPIHCIIYIYIYVHGIHVSVSTRVSAQSAQRTEDISLTLK